MIKNYNSLILLSLLISLQINSSFCVNENNINKNQQQKKETICKWKLATLFTGIIGIASIILLSKKLNSKISKLESDISEVNERIPSSTSNSDSCPISSWMHAGQ